VRRVFLAADSRLRSGWRFVLAILLFVLANIMAALIAVTFAREHSQLFELIYRTLTMVLLIAGYWWMSVRLDRVRHGAMAYQGLDTKVAWLRQCIVGFLYGAALVSIAVGIMAFAADVSFATQLSTRNLAIGVGGFVVFAIAAMLEEVAFRGYPFHRLIEGAGPVGAILIANILFGALHMGNPDFSGFAMFNTFLVGVPFALAYLFTRALWLPWGFHWGWNFTLGVLYGLKVSGADFSGPVKGTVAGPQWLTGGAYGIEGGASGTIVILIGLGGMFWVARHPALVGSPPKAVETGNKTPPAGIQAQ
jgi:membrane protease YdiL (CAAX protease family)